MTARRTLATASGGAAATAAAAAPDGTRAIGITNS
jgi:hypothetical protein